MAQGDTEDIGLACTQLARAVEVMMDPGVAQERRIEAFNQCESFKQTSPVVVQCGLALATWPQGTVRHFGLKGSAT